MKANAGSYGEESKQEQLKKGMKRGEWLWVGIKFLQSGKKEKGDNWAGVPMEAVKVGVSEEETAMNGGGLTWTGTRLPSTRSK